MSCAALSSLRHCPLALVDDLLVSLNSKDVPALRQQASELPAEVRAALLALTRLNGGREVLDEARLQAASICRDQHCAGTSLKRSSSA